MTRVRSTQGEEWSAIFTELLEWKNRALDGDVTAKDHIHRLLKDLDAAKKADR